MPSMNEKDYYAILGVPKDADKKAIQKAFQQKARKLHPDINKAPDAEERFKEVSEAYAVLSDDQKRARYDAMRSGNPFAAAGQGAPSASAYGGGYSGFSTGFTGFPFGFPFDMGGMGGRRRSGSSAYNPEEGSDVVVEVELSRDQGRDGARRAVRYRRYEPCAHCHGSGSVAAEHSRTCPTCGGLGTIAVDLTTLFGAGAVQMGCPECGGSGRVVADPCPECSGSGRTQVMAEDVIEFPAGTHDGDVVRIKGRGHAGTNGGAAGDLVGRAHVAAERLGQRAQTGFYVLGFVLPFLAFDVASGAMGLIMYLCVIGLAFGLFSILREGPFGRSGLWWRRGAAAMANGASNSVVWALMFFWLRGCSSMMTMNMYRYW